MQEKAIGVAEITTMYRTDSFLSPTGGNEHVHKWPRPGQNTGSVQGHRRKWKEFSLRRLGKAMGRKIND